MMTVYTKEQLDNMLEDVCNELDLSDSAIAEHAALGTPPAELVRKVLHQKDREIYMLKRGFRDLSDTQAEAKPMTDTQAKHTPLDICDENSAAASVQVNDEHEINRIVITGDDCWSLARRVVACVNACKGINPDAVPDMREACETAIRWMETSDDPADHKCIAARTLRAAIAKAKGETQ